MDTLLLQRALDKAGPLFNAQFVADGQEVLDYLQGDNRFADRDQFPVPGLIILDLKMPRLNGFDVLNWLKAQPRHCTTPVVILSSSDDPSDVTRAYSLGASTYLVKPPRSEDLHGLVRTFQDYWIHYSRLPSN